MDSLAAQFYNFVYTPWVVVLLFVHSFLESSVMVGAHDFFLIAVDVVRPEWCFIFAIFSSAGSACGGLFAYGIGWFGGRPLVNRFVSNSILSRVEVLFQKYGIWAVAIAGVTPLPYKVFAITAGVFQMNIMTFFIVSLVTRAIRFFSVSAILFFIGPQVKEYIINYFNIVAIIFCGGAVLIGMWIIYKKRSKQKQMEKE